MIHQLSINHWPALMSPATAERYLDGEITLQQLIDRGLNPVITGHKRTRYAKKAIDSIIDKMIAEAGRGHC
jgi:hypothetical protein